MLYYIAVALVSALVGGALAYFYQQARVKVLEAQVSGGKTLHEEYLQAARAAMLEAGNTMSSKLIDDHRRESEEAKKQAEEIARRNSEALFKEFAGVVTTLATIQQKVKENESTVGTVWRALSSPGGAGYYAEIGLENSLKEMGLMPGRDFEMQYTVTGANGRLRPDAVIFLPAGNVMVIDSKSSKFFLEMAEAEKNGMGNEAEKALAATMNRHLNELAARDYCAAVKQSGKLPEEAVVVNIMYVPNEAAVDKLLRADPAFHEKCVKHGIILSGPSGLQLLLSIARQEIMRARQEKNHKLIIEEIEGVLEALDSFFGHAAMVGKSIKAAADNFEKMGASANRRLLPRVRRAVSMGVGGTKARFGQDLPGFRVQEAETAPDEVILEKITAK